MISRNKVFVCYMINNALRVIVHSKPDGRVIFVNFVLIFLQVGVLYDEVSLQNVLDMTADWTNEEREMLRRKVLRFNQN